MTESASRCGWLRAVTMFLVLSHSKAVIGPVSEMVASADAQLGPFILTEMRGCVKQLIMFM